MKKLLHLRLLSVILLMLCGLRGGIAWAEETTYTFTSKSWAATPANWTSGQDGNGFTNGQGIQILGDGSANATSPLQFKNISKVIVKYCTNSKAGAGTIKVQVGNNTEKSFTVTKPSSGGTTLKEATFDYTTNETGLIKLTCSASANSVYIHSIIITADAEEPYTVTFDAGSGTDVPVSITEDSAGEGITLPIPTPVTGWTFAGWAKVSVNETTTAPTFVKVDAEGKYHPNSNETLYAVYLKTEVGEGETLIQTLSYDTWTYVGTATTDKNSYRLFGDGTYIESESFDLSMLKKVVVKGGTFGGSSYNGISIKDEDGNVWKTGTVSGSSETGTNNFTEGTPLSGNKKLRVYSTSGNGSGNGVRISSVEIYANLTIIYNSNPVALTTATVTGVAIKTLPTKTTYYVGEDLDLAGGEITVTYSDDSTEDIAMTAEGVTVTGFSSEEAGTKTLTITYEELTATFNVTVLPARTVVDMVLDGTLTTTSYLWGESMNYAGLEVTAEFSNGDIEYVTSSCTFSNSLGDPLTHVGSDQLVTITASFGNMDATMQCRITVSDVLNGITLKTDDVKKDYNVNETFTADGLVIIANYLSGEEEIDEENYEFYEVSVSAPDMTTEGTKPVTVSFTDLGTTVTATYDITVVDPNKVVAFLETFGDNGSTNTPIANYNKWNAKTDMFTDGNAVGTHYSGFFVDNNSCSRVGKSNQNPSEGYDSASGKSALWSQATPGVSTDELFTIKNINIAHLTSLKLTFGTYFTNGAATSNKVDIYYSIDGGEYKSLGTTNFSGATWCLQEMTIPSAGNSLSLNFKHVTNGGMTIRIDDIKVAGTFTQPAPQMVSVSGNLSSFCSVNALDFTNAENIEAYIATSVEGTTVQLTKVEGTVAAGTGLMLRGEGDVSEDIPVVRTGTFYNETNMLKPIFTGEAIAASTEDVYHYVFGTKSGVKGFYKLINNPMTSTGNFAYLESEVDYLTQNQSRGLTLNFGDDEDAINLVTSEAASQEIYTISGVRVSAPVKGINIVGGKKVFIK